MSDPTTDGPPRSTRPEGHVDHLDDVEGTGGETPRDRRPGELGARELVRWTWRQLTSMRTALILLFLLALAAVPGSLVPQEAVDSLKTSQWKDQHPTLTPIYERLGLFSVYDSPWFSAIYLLLMLSLVGCILPRTLVYARALRAEPPRTPRNLTRLPDSAAWTSEEDADDVLDRAQGVLRSKRFRVRRDADAVRAERGFLREAGNLVFHVSLLVVLGGFAAGGLLGYQGGVIVLVGGGFSNTVNSYDDFNPGSLFRADDMEPFSFRVDDFDIDWYQDGPRQGMARGFVSHLTYRTEPGAPTKEYDLKVNHPLDIGDTEVFLIGHGYAPVITIRDGNGDVAYSGPTIFLPTNAQTFESFGVAKAPAARPQQVAVDAIFYPTFAQLDGQAFSIKGEADNPVVAIRVYTGDLGYDTGEPQSVYSIDTDRATLLRDADGKAITAQIPEGGTVTLPDGLGTVSFDGLQQWNRVQISRTPGKLVALGGVVVALVGLLGSLFIRPRRAWVRVVPVAGGGSRVEVAVLDRSTAGGAEEALERLLEALGAPAELDEDPLRDPQDTARAVGTGVGGSRVDSTTGKTEETS